MNDLFRFTLLRPANLPNPDTIKPLVASFVKQGEALPIMPRDAIGYVRAHAAEMRSEKLTLADVARAVASALSSGPRPAAELEDIVKAATGDTAAALVALNGFVKEEQTLTDWLVALELVSVYGGRCRRPRAPRPRL